MHVCMPACPLPSMQEHMLHRTGAPRRGCFSVPPLPDLFGARCWAAGPGRSWHRQPCPPTPPHHRSLPPFCSPCVADYGLMWRFGTPPPPPPPPHPIGCDGCQKFGNNGSCWMLVVLFSALMGGGSLLYRRCPQGGGVSLYIHRLLFIIGVGIVLKTSTRGH